MFFKVICFQEVEATHYQSFYEPWLKSKGYDSVFKQRTGYKLDGCAIFIRNSKFEIIASDSVEYVVPGTFMDRDNIGRKTIEILIKNFFFDSKILFSGLIVILRPKCQQSDSMRLVVGTTHLLFNQKRGEIKLVQLAMMLAALEKVFFKNFIFQKLLFKISQKAGGRGGEERCE